MTAIINNCIDQKRFPDIYKVALVSPIFKKGDKTQCGNYRPISSLPIMSKVIEKVLNSQIVHHLNQNALLSNKQFGFRANISCEQLLQYIIEQFLNHLDSKKPNYIAVLSLDVKKAFDTVDHALLTAKLSKLFNFSTGATQLIASCLENRRQSLKVDSNLSSELNITKGVPQGSILGPLLFNLMVNDMLQNHENAISYADDTLIYAVAPAQSAAMNQVTLQFNKLNRWYLENGLILNVLKTKYMLLSNKATDDSIQLKLENSLLPPVKSLILLGVEIDNKLSLEAQINKIVTRANSATYTLRKIRHLLSYEDAHLLYISFIRPVLEYSSSLYLGLNKFLTTKIESAQNKAIRVICRAPKQGFSITDARILLNLHTLLSRRQFSFANLVNRILSGTGSQRLLTTIESLSKHDRSLRSNCKYILPSANTNIGKRRFSFQAIQMLTKVTPNYPSYTAPVSN